MANFETRPSFSIRIRTIVDIFAPIGTLLFGWSHALLNRSCNIVPYQANSDGCAVVLLEPLSAPSFFSALWSEEELDSFFVSLGFFSAVALGEGFAVGLGSALFFGVTFGIGDGDGFGVP